MLPILLESTFLWVVLVLVVLVVVVAILVEWLANVGLHPQQSVVLDWPHRLWAMVVG